MLWASLLSTFLPLNEGHPWTPALLPLSILKEDLSVPPYVPTPDTAAPVQLAQVKGEAAPDSPNST